MLQNIVFRLSMKLKTHKDIVLILCPYSDFLVQNGMTEYEQQREQNIKRNMKRMKDVGLDLKEDSVVSLSSDSVSFLSTGNCVCRMREPQYVCDVDIPRSWMDNCFLCSSFVQSVLTGMHASLCVKL